MKALSVKNPWASLIAHGIKTLEIRSRATKHRGPLLIVSSRGAAPELVDFPDHDAARGVALCIVDVINCRPATSADATAACIEPPTGSYAWVLSNPRPVETFPVRGQLGLYEVAMPTSD